MQLPSGLRSGAAATPQQVRTASAASRAVASWRGSMPQVILEEAMVGCEPGCGWRMPREGEGSGRTAAVGGAVGREADPCKGHLAGAAGGVAARSSG